MAENEEQTLRIERVEISRIKAGKNPRKRFDVDKVNELAASIRAQGIIQPLLVRPDWCVGKSREQIAEVNGTAPAALNYELIAGERRWRAATQEKLATAPVIVRELSDQEAMELHLIEQLQHDDWTPIEEAGGYRMLLDLRTSDGKPVYTGETLAAKIGKTKQYIYQRLKLLHLPKLAREALEQGEISGEVARLIGGIPNPELREKAALEIVKPPLQIGAMNMRQTLNHIAQNYVKSLGKAPFPLEDATLVPLIEDEDGERVGGLDCVSCPRRISQRGGDLCTNPRCYSAKCDETWRRSSDAGLALGATAPEDNRRRLSEAECARIFTAEGKLDSRSGYVDISKHPAKDELKAECGVPPQWRHMIEGAPIVLGRNPNGKVFELVERKLAVAAAEQNGFDIFARESGSVPANRADQEKDRAAKREASEAAKQDFNVSLEVLGAVVHSVNVHSVADWRIDLIAKDIDSELDGFLKALLHLGIGHAGREGRALVARRRELDDTEFALPDLAETLPAMDRLGLIAELLLSQGVKHQGIADPNLQEFIRVFGIDVKAVEARVRGGTAKPARMEDGGLRVARKKRDSVNTDHDFEKIVGNKYRCRGCGAAAVKQGKSLLVEKAARGRPCAHSEGPPSRKATAGASDKSARKAKPKHKCSHCSDEAEDGKSMCTKCLAKNAARAKKRRATKAGGKRR